MLPAKIRTQDFPDTGEMDPEEYEGRRRSIVRINLLLLSEFLKGSLRAYTSNAPDDLKIVDATIDPYCADILMLKCWSASYPSVPKGHVLPIVDITFTTDTTVVPGNNEDGTV